MFFFKDTASQIHSVHTVHSARWAVPVKHPPNLVDIWAIYMKNNLIVVMVIDGKHVKKKCYRQTSNLLCCFVNPVLLRSRFFAQLTDDRLFVLYLICLHLLLLQQPLPGIVHVLGKESDTQAHTLSAQRQSTEARTYTDSYEVYFIRWFG